MAKGGGLGGLGGRGGNAGNAGRNAGRVARNAGRNAGRNASRNARNAQRNARDAGRQADDGLPKREMDAGEAFDKNIEKGLGGIKLGGASKRLNNIRNALRRASKLQKRDAKGRFKQPRDNREVKQQADQIAADVVKDSAFEIGDIVNNNGGKIIDGAAYTKNNIYASLSPGQNGLLQQHAQPIIDRGFREGLERGRILDMARSSHPNIQEAMDQTLIDLVDLGQRVRDGINYAANQSNDN